jgi:hypothetical protein
MSWHVFLQASAESGDDRTSSEMGGIETRQPDIYAIKKTASQSEISYDKAESCDCGW